MSMIERFVDKIRKSKRIVLDLKGLVTAFKEPKWSKIEWVRTSPDRWVMKFRYFDGDVDRLKDAHYVDNTDIVDYIFDLCIKYIKRNTAGMFSYYIFDLMLHDRLSFYSQNGQRL